MTTEPVVLPFRRPEKAGRLASVDALRGLGALLVLLTHIPHAPFALPHRLALLFPVAEYGFEGVVLFLVISGFCIHLGVARTLARGDAASCHWGRFWRRRCQRLYPSYLAAILLSLLVAVIWFGNTEPFASYLQQRTSPRWDVVTHLLMIHNLFPSTIWGLGNPAFWTLGLEEQLYVLYGAFLLLRGRLSATRTFALTAAASLLWVFGGAVAHQLLVAGIWTWRPLFSIRLDMWNYWPFCFWSTWALGALAAEAYAGTVTLPGWCYRRRVAGVFLALGVLTYAPALDALGLRRLLSDRFGGELVIVRLVNDSSLVLRLGQIFCAVACFILLNRWVRAEAGGRPGGWVQRGLGRLGVLSYSLYLTHYPVIVTCEHLGHRLGVTHSLGGTALRYAVYVPLCLVVAEVFFRLIDRHFLGGSEPAAARPVPARSVRRAA